MKRSFAIALLAAGAVTLAPVEVRAQEAPPYGPQITLDVARKVAAARRSGGKEEQLANGGPQKTQRSSM